MFVRIELALSYCFLYHAVTRVECNSFYKTRSEVDAFGKGAEEKDFPRREYILSSPYLTYYSSHWLKSYNSSNLQLCNHKLMPACSTLLSLASLLLLYIYKYN